MVDFQDPLILTIFIILLIWSLFWKLKALWQAARNNQLTWFILLGLINTIGILEIIYLNFFQKKVS